jgi:hypothetical protein
MLSRRMSWWLWVVAVLGWAYLPRSISWLGLWLFAGMLALAAYGGRWRHASVRRVLTALPLCLAALPIVLVLLVPVRVTAHREPLTVSSGQAAPACTTVYLTGQVGAVLGSATHLNAELCTDGRDVWQKWSQGDVTQALAVTEIQRTDRRGADGGLTIGSHSEVSPATFPFLHRSVTIDVSMRPDGRLRLSQ